MIAFGLELRRAPIKEPKVVSVACSHCGKSFFVAKANLRVGNYCNSCK